MEKVLIRRIDQVTEEPVGDMVRQVLFGPEAVGNPRLKVALNQAPPNAAAQPHTHPGEEIVLTLEGEATLHVGEEQYSLLPGTAAMVPPGLEHFAVASAQGWKALAIFCDECPLLSDK